MISWYENNEFWEVMEQKIFADKNPAETKKEVEQIISLTGIVGNSKILDLCCGQGRHSLEFARRGFKVTGIDRTKKYLERAIKEATRKNLSIEFTNEDIRNFKSESYFDMIINMYTSFGYFEKHEENMKVLHNCYESLSSNGKLLIDLVGKEILKKKFKESESTTIEGITYIEQRKLIGDWKMIENKWKLINGLQEREFKLSHWLYSAEELKEMLSETGFHSIKIFGDLSGIRYDENAKRLIAIAVK